MDLRSTIAAVARLLFDGDGLVEILCQFEPGAANNPNDEEHTIFWLVVADQFARRAIACARVREKALTVIDDGSDLAMHAKLGMSPADLKKRRKVLAELRARLTVVTADSLKRRSILRRPQPFLMDVGECLIYPTSGEDCINSYYAPKNKIPGWKHDGWSAMVVVDRGRAFDFLTWYTPVTVSSPTAEACVSDAEFNHPLDSQKVGNLLRSSFQTAGIGKNRLPDDRPRQTHTCFSHDEAWNLLGYRRHFDHQFARPPSRSASGFAASR